MKDRQNVQCSTFNAQRSTSSPRRSAFGVRCSTSPSPFASPRLCVKNPRRGATLLVTLGILTVLSVLAVAFLVRTRIQRQTAASLTNRFEAKEHLHVALYQAMSMVEQALCHTNYTDVQPVTDAEDTAFRTPQRVVPLGAWFSEGWMGRNEIAQKYAFQAPGLLVSPLLASNEYPAAWTANLITPQVLSLIPAALTNRLDLTGSGEKPLRIGWQELAFSEYDNEPWKQKRARVAFAVFDVSGFIDANYFISGPTTQKIPRVFFSQPDVAKWLENKYVADQENSYFHLSYDPNPNVMPLAREGVKVNSAFGTRTFDFKQKFDITSITNFFLSMPEIGVKDRLIAMSENWYRNVNELLQSASISNLYDNAGRDGRDAFFGETRKLAWNMVNFMTGSRVPTAFAQVVVDMDEHPSRLDYAIEAVPLINEVELKDIFNGASSVNDLPSTDELYQNELERIREELLAIYTPAAEVGAPQPAVEIEWSNFYAFDVELWYPFLPAPVPQHTHLWLSVTTNPPALFVPTRSPYSWRDEYAMENSLGRVLFSRWNAIYADNQPDAEDYVAVTNDLVWEVIQSNAVLLAYIENPDGFNDATNQTEIAEAFSALWLLTYTNDTASVTPELPYTYTMLTTTRPYTNRMTHAVLSNDYERVTSVLKTPYDERMDYEDGNAWATSYRELFNQTSAQFFSQYEKHEVLLEDFNIEKTYHVFNSTNLVYFPYVVTNKNDDLGTVDSIHIKFHKLSGEESSATEDDTGELRATWLRPMVTVGEIDLEVLGLERMPESVDEALLIRGGTSETGFYKRWDKPGAISIDEPRDNAWADRWSEQGDVTATMGEKNENCTVAELPFIHYDRPFRSIGEVGHIVNDLTNRFAEVRNRAPHPSGLNIRRDTIDLSTRSGAALIDKFCVGSVSNSVKGLVQANTTYPEAVRHIFDKIQIGYPLNIDLASYNQDPLDQESSQIWVDHWGYTLSKVYDSTFDHQNNGLPGWSSYADMLSDLGTNAMHKISVNTEGSEITAGEHDYLEDALRGIIGKVSFRQNIFVVVIAAQTLSPISTPSRPVVLTDQRAAVTVIRDAFTGRWVIHSWRWLTE